MLCIQDIQGASNTMTEQFVPQHRMAQICKDLAFHDISSLLPRKNHIQSHWMEEWFSINSSHFGENRRVVWTDP